MAMYAIGTKPLLDTLTNSADPKLCRQVWYADDSDSAGKLNEMKKWCDVLNEIGPKFGYHLNAEKILLIVNDNALNLARDIFGNTSVTIDEKGERRLGAPVGSDEFKEWYVNRKIG